VKRFEYVRGWAEDEREAILSYAKSIIDQADRHKLSEWESGWIVGIRQLTHAIEAGWHRRANPVQYDRFTRPGDRNLNP
jgi:hypothetical protein